MNAHPFRLALILLGTAVLSSCSMAPVIGDRYGEPPPQVAHLGAKDPKGQPFLTWVHVSSFGPVPSHLQSVGDITCMKVDQTLRAVGYHPQAKDLQGRATPGGGFFCQPKLLGNLVDDVPPKVVMVNGSSNWDRPGLFKPIPQQLMPAALQECRFSNVQWTPLGYHPQPLDAQGQPMTKPGFLCVE